MQFEPAKKKYDSVKKEHSQQTSEICKRICLEYEVQNKGDLAKNWEIIYPKLVFFKRLKGQLVTVDDDWFQWSKRLPWAIAMSHRKRTSWNFGPAESGRRLWKRPTSLRWIRWWELVFLLTSGKFAGPGSVRLTACWPHVFWQFLTYSEPKAY